MIFVGIDWGQRRHYVVVLDQHGQILQREWIGHNAEELRLLDWLLTHGRDPRQVHVAIELHDSLLLDRLLGLGVNVYGLNPKSAERARERFTPAGIKDDQRDGWSLAEFLRTSYQHLRALRADSDTTAALREWVRLREDLVQERTVQLQRLRDHLVRWHPQALQSITDLNRDWALDLLERFATADGLAALRWPELVAWGKGRRLRLTTLARLGDAANAPSPTERAVRNPAHPDVHRDRGWPSHPDHPGDQ